MNDSISPRFERLQRGVEFLANLGIIVVVLIGAAVLVWQWQPGRIGRAGDRASSAVNTPSVGTALTVPGLDFSGTDQTLVLVLSTRCRFCSESGPFYQRLALQARRNGRTRVVAVFPEAAVESERFLMSLGVSVETVMTLPLSAVGTEGTPTLLLVGSDGRVKISWVGRLSPARESEVTEAIGGTE